MAPWGGPRHQSWAANTNVATVALAILFLTWLIWEIAGTAPPLLAQLLGPATGIWFASVAGDQKKKQDEVAEKADQAETRANDAETRADAAQARVDRVENVVRDKHPEASGELESGGGRHE